VTGGGHAAGAWDCTWATMSMATSDGAIHIAMPWLLSNRGATDTPGSTGRQCVRPE